MWNDNGVQRTRVYKEVKESKGDLVYYQHQDRKAWMGLVKVFAVKGKDVFIFANGNVRKVPRCNVQLCESEEEESKNEECEESKNKETHLKFNDENFGDGIVEEDLKGYRRVMHSMTDVQRRDLDREEISTYWLKIENSECFDEVLVYMVEVPVRGYKKPEVIEAKAK